MGYTDGVIQLGTTRADAETLFRDDSWLASCDGENHLCWTFAKQLDTVDVCGESFKGSLSITCEGTKRVAVWALVLFLKEVPGEPRVRALKTATESLTRLLGKWRREAQHILGSLRRHGDILAVSFREVTSWTKVWISWKCINSRCTDKEDTSLGQTQRCQHEHSYHDLWLG